ncbi:MAG: ceramidase domain-containing protein [Pseudomonadota bacterium]
MPRITLRQWSIAAGWSVLAALLTTGALMLLGPDYSRFAAATCTATRCFCETPRLGALILQPSDSWSAYGYVLAGFLMIVLARAPAWDSAFPRTAAAIFGVTAIMVGIGSVLLHATLTLWGQFLDVLGMYLVGSFLLVRAVARWRSIPDRIAILMYLILCAALTAVLIVEPEVRRWLFAVVLIAAILLELVFARPLRNGALVRFYLLGILAKAVAFAIWIMDQRGTLCAPESIVQGHAVWHLLGALSIWLSFSYYRSEKPAEAA